LEHVFVYGISSSQPRRTNVASGSELGHPSLALCVFVQPDKMAEMARNRSLLSSGLVARLNLVQPRSRVGLRLESEDQQPFPEAVRRQWCDSIKPIIRVRYEVVDREGQFERICLRLSDEAMEARRSFANEVEVRQREGEDLADVSEWASKVAGEAARLAALFHLFECGRQGFSPEEQRIVPIECWRWAEAHQRWQLQETLRVLGLVQEGEAERRARRLLGYIARAPGGRSTVTASDVVSFKVARNVEEAERILRLLLGRGWVREVPPHGKQRTSRWEFHPLVWQEPEEDAA